MTRRRSRKYPMRAPAAACVLVDGGSDCGGSRLSTCPGHDFQGGVELGAELIGVGRRLPLIARAEHLLPHAAYALALTSRSRRRPRWAPCLHRLEAAGSSLDKAGWYPRARRGSFHPPRGRWGWVKHSMSRISTSAAEIFRLKLPTPRAATHRSITSRTKGVGLR
jgi:hypothetical protein